jgi:hypothetical protein
LPWKPWHTRCRNHFLIHNGQLYLTSMFAAGLPFPRGKSWVTNVMRDSHVRLKFGNNSYDCILSPVTDPDERAAVLGPREKQNPQPTVSNATNGPVVHLFYAVSEESVLERPAPCGINETT